MESVKGILFIVSCHKYKDTRLKEFIQLPISISNYKVLIFMGDPRLTTYKVEDNLITLPCEDSYLHLFKKECFALEFIKNHYIVEEGIMRINDDCIINQELLEAFLEMKKPGEYLGNVLPRTKEIHASQDYHLVEYYNHHKKDFDNPLHGISELREKYKELSVVPYCTLIPGYAVYLSWNACNHILNYFKNCGYNSLHFDQQYGYPFILEDIAIGFILNKVGIFPQNYSFNSDILGASIVYHTNKYRELDF